MKKNEKLLDVGFYNINRGLHEKYQYYGIDADPQKVIRANKASRTQWFKQCNLPERIPFPDQFFHRLLCREVLEHIDMQGQWNAFLEFNRVLRKGGLIYLTTRTPYHWRFYDEPTHVKPNTHGSLRVMAQQTGFEILKLYYTPLRYLPLKLQVALRELGRIIPNFCSGVVLRAKKVQNVRTVDYGYEDRDEAFNDIAIDF